MTSPEPQPKPRRRPGPAPRPTYAKPHLLTTGQVGNLLGTAPRTVQKWVDAGLIPGAYILPHSSDRRIPRAGLVQFLRQHGVPIPPAIADAATCLVATCTPAIVHTAHIYADRAAITVVADWFELGVEAAALTPTVVIIDLALGATAGVSAARRLLEGTFPPAVAVCTWDVPGIVQVPDMARVVEMPGGVEGLAAWMGGALEGDKREGRR